MLYNALLAEHYEIYLVYPANVVIMNYRTSNLLPKMSYKFISGRKISFPIEKCNFGLLYMYLSGKGTASCHF